MNTGSPPSPDRLDVSVVVPAHNEQDNVVPLIEQFAELSRRARFSLEVILVDDGSTDQTLPRAVEAQHGHRFVKIIPLPRRRGLTEALRAGFSQARGEIIVFYPADRQFHPADIPRLIEKVRSGYDLVTGRKIGQYSKKFVSSFYNRLSRWLFPAIQVSDLNSVKAFRRDLMNVFDYRHDWHRFWVAIVSEAGYRVGEVDVTLYPRPSGRSKYGFWRIPGGILDLLAVKFQYSTMRRPLRYFGMTGMALIGAAVAVGLVELYQRFVLGHGYRPILYLIMTLSLTGVVFFALGFLAESVAGVRQQLEMLKPPTRYPVYRGTSGPHPQNRPDRSGDRPERTNVRADRRDRMREGHRHDRRRTERGEATEPPVARERPSAGPVPAETPEVTVERRDMGEPVRPRPEPERGPVEVGRRTDAQTGLFSPLPEAKTPLRHEVADTDEEPVDVRPQPAGDRNETPPPSQRNDRPAEQSPPAPARPNQYGRRNRP